MKNKNIPHIPIIKHQKYHRKLYKSYGVYIHGPWSLQIFVNINFHEFNENHNAGIQKFVDNDLINYMCYHVEIALR